MKVKLLYIVVISVFILGLIEACSVFHRSPGLTDHHRFPFRDMHAHSRPFMFPKCGQYSAPRPDSIVINNKPVVFDKYLSENRTTGFLIIHNDTIVYEKYFGGNDSSTLFPSFAIANVYTSALIGCAIDDGLIESVNQPVTDFIPELAANGFSTVTIRHLLQMTAGLDFKENFTDPFAEGSKFYYGTDLRFNTIHLTLKRMPGTTFDFTSGSVQLLGLILTRVLKGETVTHYFDRRVWFPLEAEFDGTWSLDKTNGTEKMFCCINASARDFAKFGRLYAEKGMWNGKKILSPKWVSDSHSPDISNGGSPYFKYQWWLIDNGNSFCAEGMHGQYLYVNPAKHLVIVRFGNEKGNVNWQGLFEKYASSVY